MLSSSRSARLAALLFLCLGLLPATAQLSNLAVRVVAANLNDNSQTYEAPQIRILQGLKPDVVAIQEFNYLSNSTNDVRSFVNQTFGTNFSYHRESSSYQIPNGVISRWPITDSGSWADPEVGNRGFAWAQIDLPGTNDLYVVSLHLLNSGTPTERNNEALAVRSNILASFPAGAWIIVAGDFNTSPRTEPAIDTFKTFLSDHPIPSDAVSGGNENTNLGRDKPYDYVLPSFSLTNWLTSVVMPSHTFPKGLVFDTRVYTPTNDFFPALSSDSAACQHMAVIKDFLLPVFGTNAGPVAPSITAQPLSQTNTVGSPALFSVTASGTAPLAHQWRFFGTNLPGATATNLSFASLTTNDAGPYTVVITNLAGSVTSSVATLTVTVPPTNAPPAITTQPVGQSVATGGTASFFVIATGTAPLAHQWRLHGTNLPGATATNYSKASVTTNDAGPYTVVITNNFGSITSSVATLTVTVPVYGGNTNIVISQIYGGGGNAGASYQNDFVELFNPTASAVSLAGWTLQYANVTGSTWSQSAQSGTIQPYSYYLIRLGSSGAVGLVLPSAEATNTGVNISATGGKLALVRNNTALTGTTPLLPNTAISDFVGYGSNASAFEGSGPVVTISGNTNSLLRLNGGLTDSDNNTNDFVTLSPPTPRNSSSAANPPANNPPASAPALSTPALNAGLLEFTVTGTAGTNYIVQASTNLAVSNWFSLRTNAAPFSYTESNLNSAPQKFYRGMLAP